MSLTETDFEKMHGLRDETENPRAKAGGNNPPDAIERSKTTLSELSEFLKAEPIIGDEVLARKAKLLIDRAKASLEEMNAERDSKVRPLNERVRSINAAYKGPGEILRTALVSITARLNSFIDRQRAEAEEKARKAAEEAEQKIREAEEALKAKEEANDSVSQGEVGIDTISAEQEARQKVEEANHAIRVAKRAEKETNIRIGGGFSGRVLTQKTKETIVITDRHKLLTALEYPASVDDAMITAARAYRKLKGELPEGCISEKEKSL